MLNEPIQDEEKYPHGQTNKEDKAIE